MDEPEGDPHSGKEMLNSPKTYLHVSPYPEQHVRTYADNYVRLDSNDYSVHPAVIGRRIEVIADLARVRAFCAGRTVADHERIWGWHQTISDPEHVAAAKALRRDRVGVLRPVPEPDVQIRCLGDYDTALGLDGGVA